jgi:hypothetical protein
MAESVTYGHDVAICSRLFPAISGYFRKFPATPWETDEHEPTSFAQHATTMFFPHFVGDAFSGDRISSANDAD